MATSKLKMHQTRNNIKYTNTKYLKQQQEQPIELLSQLTN